MPLLDSGHAGVRLYILGLHRSRSAFIPIYPNALPTVSKPSRASRTATGLLPSNQRIDAESVLSLNGIAYDPRHDPLFVTGKQWPTVFGLKVIQHTRGASHSP
ncbi:MAG TPA: glutaminyl-peptide cyclotransferase [Candidatus Eisenbacteria bacterium]|nr:glutaminyl-peptide cyclotransferase [Candidatus Eisenbacteria bacterium]